MEEHFSVLTLLLADALDARGKKDVRTKVAAYLERRHELEQTLSPDDYAYFSFQLWQEGISRYTEYRVAKLAALRFTPSRAYWRLPDYRPFAEVADQTMKQITKDLRTSQLADYKRVIFYALGAGEGLLLDRDNPGWRQRYLIDKFYLNKYFRTQPAR
jgi:hypothetical protein